MTDDLDALLGRMGRLPARLAAEAARADQEGRWRRGERVPAERYLDALPHVADSPEDALVVIYGEILLGGPADLDRFRDRYPHLREHLDALADVHRAFAEVGLTAADQGASPRATWQQPTAPGAPPLPTPGAPAAPSLPGFEAVRLVGQGGMGVVWEARQLALNRTVALKLIRTADLAGPEEVLRFLAESEALAAVEHPNVVRVYEAGRHNGQPYMALEYVAGGSLADRLRERPLAPAEAARLVEQVALGVQAVNEKGIVHRDLKPGNVLLSVSDASRKSSAPEGFREASLTEPKVTDFGLARRVEASEGLTLTGAVVGTPSYMPPEQARGDSKLVGPAADVYALGAVLYECLAGRPPFVGSTAVDVLMQVVGDEPVPLRSLAPKAPRDLATVCHKCLHKEPARRYASAGELADDLRRWRAGEPIAARPVGPAERALKWVRKRPAVAGLLAAIVIGVGLAFWALRREQVRTAGERDRAVAAEREAVRAVDDCFGIARDDPAFQAEHMRPARDLLLAKTLDFYNGFADRLADDPALEGRHARYLVKAAEITAEIGRKADAASLYGRAEAILERLAWQRAADTEIGTSLGEVHNNLGLLRAQMGDFPGAMESHRRAGDIFERLRRDHPKEAAYQLALSGHYHLLGNLLARQGNAAEALKNYELARDLRQRLYDAQPDLASHRYALARVYHSLATAQRRLGRSEDAVAGHAKARDLLRGLARSAPRVSRYEADLALSLHNLALAHGSLNQPREEQAAYEEAAAIRGRLADRHPEVTQYQSDLASTTLRLAELQMEANKPGDAVRSFGQARHAAAALAKADPGVPLYLAWLAKASGGLGRLHLRGGQAAEARRHYADAAGAFRRLVAAQPDDPDYPASLAETLYNLSILQRKAGQDAEADAGLTEAVTLVEAAHQKQPAYPAYRLVLRRCYGARAGARTSLGQHADAVADWDAVLRLGPTPVERNYALLARAASRTRLGQYRQALAEAEHVAGGKAVSGPALYNLGCVAALAAQAAARDTSRPLAERERFAEGAARRAVALLARAGAVGYFADAASAARVDKDDDLAFLRGREDFERWRATLP